jgi:hypothetical protein
MTKFIHVALHVGDAQRRYEENNKEHGHVCAFTDPGLCGLSCRLCAARAHLHGGASP